MLSHFCFLLPTFGMITLELQPAIKNYLLVICIPSTKGTTFPYNTFSNKKAKNLACV